MSYRSLWRRLKRRQAGTPWLSTILGSCIVYPAPVLCWLEWLHPGSIAPSLAHAAHLVWLIFLLFMVICVMFVWLMNRLIPVAGPQFPQLEQMKVLQSGVGGLLHLCGYVIVLVVFLQGRLDWSLLCWSLLMTLTSVKKSLIRKEGQMLPLAMAEALLAVAVLLHSGGLAIIWAVVTPLAHSLFRPGLTASVRMMFSRAELAQEIRRSVESQEWEKPEDKVYSGLFWFRSYALWEAAGQWLEESGDTLSPVCVTCWQTMIAVGQGQYERAPELEGLLPHLKRSGARRLTAVAYARLGRREDALRVLEAHTKLDRRERSHWLGDIHLALGEWELALSHYERVRRKREVYYGMATCLTHLGEHREARNLYRCAVQYNLYARVDYLRELATCCWRIGDERMAQEAERLALEKED